MRGLGTIINALAIVIGGVLGILFKRFLKEHYQDTIIKATGFSVVFLGAAGCDRGGLGLLHLRLGGPHRLRQHGHLPAAGEGVPTGAAAAEAGGDPLRPQRRGL